MSNPVTVDYGSDSYLTLKVKESLDGIGSLDIQEKDGPTILSLTPDEAFALAMTIHYALHAHGIGQLTIGAEMLEA